MDIEEVRNALRSYDYVLEGDTWYHRLKHNTTQSWKEAASGFLRYDPVSGAWEPVPYKVKPEFEGTGGLDFRNPAHTECFEWVWPYEHIEHIYREAWESKRKRALEREEEKGKAALEVARTSPTNLETINAVREQVEHATEAGLATEEAGLVERKKKFGLF